MALNRRFGPSDNAIRMNYCWRTEIFIMWNVDPNTGETMPSSYKMIVNNSGNGIGHSSSLFRKVGAMVSRLSARNSLKGGAKTEYLNLCATCVELAADKKFIER